jgi:hypothetical protein
MYHIKVIRKNEARNTVHVGIPCENYQVTINEQDKDFIVKRRVTIDGKEQVRNVRRHIRAGIHIDLTRYEDMRDENGDYVRDEQGNIKRKVVIVEVRLPEHGDSLYVEDGMGNTVNAYHWPLRVAKAESKQQEQG